MIDVELPIPVELLCMTQRAPLLLHGILSEEHDAINGSEWWFTSNSEIPMSVQNMRAILNFNKELELPRLSLTISLQVERNLKLELTQIHPREKRLFPRLFGRVPLKLKEINADSDIESWLNGESPTDDSWLEPEPFMNFSVNGASFSSSSSFVESSQVLVAFDFDAEYRGVARVIRCRKKDEKYSIALYFETIPDEAIQYLTQLTLRLQENPF